MPKVTSILDRLTYANVAATGALFVSLGGVSVAAIVIPAHSVGTKQLRAGAITPATLSFPLGAAGLTDQKVEDLAKDPCNSPPRPGEPLRAACPALKQSGVLTPGREVHIRLRGPGQLLVSAIAGLRDEGPTGTTATVTLHLVIDGHLATANDVTLDGGHSLQAPAQLLQSIPAGSHTVGIEATATYSSREPGDVLVSSVSLIASIEPRQT